ncbi:MAG: asparaginase [Planctomycetota bacterium]
MIAPSRPGVLQGGAEGFLALGVAGEDLGLAIKIDDGATRGCRWC